MFFLYFFFTLALATAALRWTIPRSKTKLPAEAPWPGPARAATSSIELVVLGGNEKNLQKKTKRKGEKQTM